LFVGLVVGAWIGTAGEASTHVGNLIRESLGLGKWVVIGIEHQRQEGALAGTTDDMGGALEIAPSPATQGGADAE
jgi:hypothetical protein